MTQRSPDPALPPKRTDTAPHEDPGPVGSVESLIAELARQDIRLRLDEGSILKFDAPQGAMTPELQGRLRARKPEIIAFLSEAESRRSIAAEQGLHIPTAPKSETYPVSFAQRRLWYMHRMAPEGTAYNAPVLLELEGRLDTEALFSALNALVARHEILHTVYHQSRDEEPVQRVLPSWTLSIEETDLTASASPEDALADAIREAALTPFVLERDLPIRAQLVRMSSDRWVLILTLHHIVADGWSLGVLIREVQSLYGSFVADAASDLPPPALQYKDFAVWQRDRLTGRRLEHLVDFWKKTLSGAPTELDIVPDDSVRSDDRKGQAGIASFRLDTSTSERLDHLAHGESATLFMIAATAYATVLSNLTRQDELLLGAGIANRDHQAIEGLIGFFVNTLPLRVDLSGCGSLRELLRRIKVLSLDAFAHQALPFDVMVEAVNPERAGESWPLIQAVLVVQNAPGGSLTLPNLVARPLPPPHQGARNRLELHIWTPPEGGMGGILYYDKGLFSDDTGAHIAAAVERVLNALATDPEMPPLSVPLSTASEQRTLLAPSETAVPDGTIIELITRRAQSDPNSIALQSGDEQLSYDALERRTTAVAHRLRIRLGSKPAPVGLHMDRGIPAIIVLLGCWKAGLAYVPLSPEDPPARSREIIEDADVALVVSETATDSAAWGVPILPPAELLSPDVGLDAQADGSLLPPKPEDPAYILFTSGSTGRPKGVLIEHRGITNLALAQAKAFGVENGSRVLQFAALTFDASVSEIAVTLAAGATLCIEPRDAMVPGAPLTDLMARLRISDVTLPPSVLALMTPERLPDLKTVVVAGEACPPQLAERWSVGRRFINAYGPTENTVCATLHSGRTVSNAVPIGRAMQGVDVWILNRAGTPLPPGFPGEIHLGGVGLARGYINRPGETARRFKLPSSKELPRRTLYATGDVGRYRSDGNILFLGRLDQETKLRGMRIDPGEIEHRLREVECVVDAVVVPVGDGETRRLVGFVVPDFTSPSAVLPHQDETRDSYAIITDHLNDWRTLFDTVLSTPGETDGLFNPVGWRHSIGGGVIDPSEMRSWCSDVLAVAKRETPGSILELGCGSGMLMWDLADHCSRYVGIDLSPETIRYLRKTKEKHAPRFDHVTLASGPAHAPPDIDHGTFDIVLIHSVVQYFPDADYLDLVLGRALETLAEGGLLIVGDIRNLALQRTLAAAIVSDQSPDTSADARRRLVLDRMADEEELLIDPEWLIKFAEEHPDVARIDFRLQRGEQPNELNRYRYSALLRKAESGSEGTVSPERKPTDPELRSGAGISLAELRRTLTDPDIRSVIWTGIGNALLATHRLSEAALFDDTPSPSEPAVTPESLHRIGEELGFDVVVSWTRDPGDGCLDVGFARLGDPLPQMPLATKGRIDPPGQSTNSPIGGRREADLLDRCRTHLDAHLPPHMVPPTLSACSAIPLTRHGKVDRSALLSQAKRSSKPPLRPGNSLEQVACEVFADVLNLPDVRPDDDFFRLGGHSLLAVRLSDRLAERFERSVPLSILMAHPTPEAVAAFIGSDAVSAGTTPTSPLLLRLGGGSTGQPIFLVPPAAGSPLCYIGFVGALRTDRPVWGLQCPGLDPGEAPLTDIEGLVDAFITAIKTLQPSGPYHLAGWSFGGLLCYAIAGRLLDQGDAVDTLALIDSGVSSERRRPKGLRANLLNAYQTVVGIGFLILQAGRIRRFSDIARLAQAAGISLPRSWEAARRVSVWREALGQAIRSLRVFRANMRAANAFKPSPYDGIVSLFRAAPADYSGVDGLGDPVLKTLEPLVSTPVQVYHVTGNHMTIMLDPQEVQRFAHRFSNLKSVENADPNAHIAREGPPR